MFVVNWLFGASSSNVATKEVPPPPKTTAPSPPSFQQQLTSLVGPNYHVLSEGEYSTIMNRLGQLEALLKQKAEEPSVPKVQPESHRNQPHYDAFQRDLFSRVQQLRTGMGASHGFGVGDLDELIKLEQSICL